MKISTSWLREFVAFDETPEELAALLTAIGLEATVESQKYEFSGVVVGRVLEVAPLPNSDHLSLCVVDVGDGEVPIVCGAPNVEPGILAPVAKVGASLPGIAKIKKSKIRGQVSQGMICAEDELGLSDDHTGIIVIEGQAQPGQDFKDYLKSSGDTVLDLDLTPNRGDCFSHLGVARDLAAKLHRRLKMPEIAWPEEGPPAKDLARVEISAPKGCHRYAARVITGVKIGPSPDWLTRRLSAVGLRPINNVVDASNYVLMELGHPLHIFDYDRLANHRIDVYFAQAGQTFTTLDGVQHRLGPQHLMIADGDGPVALAGIMGGLDSEVTDETTNVLIESAYFDPAVIRLGSKTLDLSTEASKRFERDTDIDGLLVALDRVSTLVCQLAGGTLAPGRIDVYPVKHKSNRIELSTKFTNRLLGTKMSRRLMQAHLKWLGITSDSKGTDGLVCTIPTSRPELTLPVDLIEEIARMEGYDNLPSIDGVGVSLTSYIGNAHDYFTTVRHTLVDWGFFEHRGNSLTREDYAGLYHQGDASNVQNPLSSELACLRTSLIPGLLQAVGFNERRQQKNVQLFEIGAVQHRDESLYNHARETFRLSLVTTVGKSSAAIHWKDTPPRDIYFLKGVVTQLLASLETSQVNFMAVETPNLV
ncbi:MAG: phenylalanine--tRNA ligase subunit beta, partial [Candidatus Neomarinimicrobiota bacterium]